MSETVIKVENLSKKYILCHQSQERYTALRDVMSNGVKRLGKKILSPLRLRSGQAFDSAQGRPSTLHKISSTLKPQQKNFMPYGM